jgi:uncharacterized protein YpmS
MYNSKKRIVIPLILVSLILLSCQLSSLGVRKTPTPVPTPISNDLNSGTSPISINGDKATITLSEAQISGYMDKYLSENNQLPIQKPQVHLQNGQIDFSGVLNQGLISGNIQLTLQPTVTPDGGIHLSVVKATMGQYPLPQSLLDSFSTQIDQSASQLLSPTTTGYKIETISIENGLMIIQAKVQ